MSRDHSQYFWYMAGVASQFVPFGIHNVVFAWLVVVHLQESGTRLGIAQMCTQLPGLMFILFGGLLADRLDRRKILIAFHVLASLPVFTLVLGIESGALSYSALLAFAVCVGTFNAFIQPARDSLLNQVSGNNLQRAVTVAMGLSFASQIIGFAVASRADNFGPVPILLVQGSVLLLGAVFAYRLPSFKPEVVADHMEPQRRTHLGQIADGLSLVFHSDRMRPVMILMAAVGVFYVGCFSVVNPLVVRDIYGGAAAEIALSFICFMVGTIFTTVLLVVIGGIHRQGLGLMVALVAGGFFLAFAAVGLPFPLYLFCIGCWGVCGGLAMSLGRSIVQESAPMNFRARAMSIYLLGTMGGMPIGSLLMGYLATMIGPLMSFLVAVLGIWIVVAWVGLRSRLVDVGRLAEPM